MSKAAQLFEILPKQKLAKQLSENVRLVETDPEKTPEVDSDEPVSIEMHGVLSCKTSDVEGFVKDLGDLLQKYKV